MAKVVATIEARMGSSRLPGKVLKVAAGTPLLALMVERVRRSRYVDEVVVATTTMPGDDAIAELCQRLGIRAFRGSEDDVLGRVVEAGRSAGAETSVLLTGDCPLIDPVIVDHVVCAFLEASPHVQYASNVEVRSYPDGLDVQVLAWTTLEESSRLAHERPFREHVGWYIRRHPERYRRIDVVAPAGLANASLRLTLDSDEDYRRICRVFEALYPTKEDFSLVDVLKLLAEGESSQRP